MSNEPLCRIIGPARRNIGREADVFRNGRWVRDTVAYEGDVTRPTPVERARFAHRYEPVEAEGFYPPLPGAEDSVASSEDGGPVGGHATASADDGGVTDSPGIDTIDLDLYRVGDTDVYALPNGAEVVGVAAARTALGITDGEGA